MNKKMFGLNFKNKKNVYNLKNGFLSLSKLTLT